MDVAAYLIVSGRPVEARGINAEGLKRRGFTADQLRNLKAAYRTVFRDGLKLDEAIATLERLVGEQPELVAFIESLRSSSRGLTR
jgi:UDP-N-acetylglucosamine acyltransferase